MSFAAELRALRRSVGLTQEELAERAGLTVHGVSALERGARTRPHPHTVRSLVRGLGLDADGERRLVRLASGATTDPQASMPTWMRTPTPTVGRSGDVAQVVGAIEGGARLVTLTGPGGVGKTRLATDVAAHLHGRWASEVLVPLAVLRDEDLVVAAIADAYGVESLAQLPDRLPDGRHLMVLDNVEHVLGAAGVVAELLAAVPALTVLATSRAPLRLRGEREIVVAPLALPGDGPAWYADGAVPVPASVQLFLERAREASGYEPGEAEAATVAEICRRLAGLPLALELAAARLRALTPAQLLERLDAVLSMQGARDLPERQRTLEATMDWSLSLLEPAERDLFGELGVFVAGFDLDALQMLRSGDPADDDVLPLLERLVEQSLVVVEHGDDGAVYSLLEPVRAYAERTLDADRLADLRHRHARAFLRRAEDEVAGEPGVLPVQWAERAAWENANLHAALRWALDAGDGDAAARLCWALWVHWWIRGHHAEGRARAEAALRLPVDDDVVRARALLSRATMAYAQGDVGPALEAWTETVRITDPVADPVGHACGTAGLGLAAMARGDLADAEEHLSAARELTRGIGEAWLAPLTSIWLGTIALIRGDTGVAEPLFEEALETGEARGDRLLAYTALLNLARTLAARGDLDAARGRLHQVVLLSSESVDRANLAYALEALAALTAERGANGWDAVAELLGAAEGLRRVVGSPVYSYYLADGDAVAALEGRAREALGPEQYDEARRRGTTAALDDVVALALGC